VIPKSGNRFSDKITREETEMNRDATDLAGVRHLAYETLGSTNAEALALARAGERPPFWVSAQSQSAGRGRRGRTWVSEPGNLYASLLLFDPAPAEHVAQLSFVAALAVRDAIAQAAPALAAQLSLKWPNDVLLAGEKVAGLLIEGEVARGQPVTAVIGIGINCVSHPADAAFPATDLRTQGSAAAPQSLLPALAAALHARIAQWDRGASFAGIRADWLTGAHKVGETIRVSNGGGERSGRFAGLDATGRLLLDLPDGTRQEIAAGDVFPLLLRAGARDPLPRG
jgi:BirA family biotin operon repressor/biotin-[acetyl-CoA-carboxylase] ligase